MLPTMTLQVWHIARGLELIERELMLFALFWFVLGVLDELLVDVVWFVLRIFSRYRTAHLPADAGQQPLVGTLAVFIPAWHESQVIGPTVRHMLDSWKSRDFIIYVGCYCNDNATIAAATQAIGADKRVRIVINQTPGPTTKADCLNRVYEAMAEDEMRLGRRFSGIILHDSEDMVHELELHLIDGALAEVDFVQIPVFPAIPPQTHWTESHWISGHYCDEFVESHAKAMVVRDALGAALPAAGTGCGFSRDVLEAIRKLRWREGEEGPFAADCLTEDYELGLLVKRCGGRSRFLRRRDASGALIATRSYFPATLGHAVKQKSRWTHGIALQSWERLGWDKRLVDNWMSLRDRRGPLMALVLLAAYALLAIGVLRAGLHWAGYPVPPVAWGGTLAARMAIGICTFGLVWRAFMRVVFTTREYGLGEGGRSLLRIPIANIITIMAGRRALVAYCRTLLGGTVTWEKTEHLIHPALRNAAGKLAPLARGGLAGGPSAVVGGI
jgi:adsorption protein B